ncbi:MAG: hypothetical protein ACTHM1_12050 [Solirubrobacteraceae bacterium]
MACLAVSIAALIAAQSPVAHAHASHRTKPAGACKLTTRYYAQGFEVGDTKSFGVKFELVGKAQVNSGLPWSMRARIKDRNQHLVICRLDISVTVPEPKPTGGILTKKVHIGPRGGASSVVTFPPGAFSPEAEIYARQVANASAAALRKHKHATHTKTKRVRARLR